MSINITEGTIGIWFVTIPNGDYLAHIARLDAGGCEMIYRFRYYKDDKAWDSKDEKNWYRGTIADVDKAVDRQRIVAKTLSCRAVQLWEILRGSGTIEDFMEQFAELPFVHRRSERIGLIDALESP